MKRILLWVYFFLSLVALHSMDGEAGISLGVLGIGLNSDMCITGGCFYGRLLNFTYQSEAGFGVTASPFISVNAINYNNPQFVEFHSGLVFSVRNILREIYYPNGSIFDSDVLLVESGYKYNKTEKHRFYAQVSIDLVAVLMFLASDSEER